MLAELRAIVLAIWAAAGVPESRDGYVLAGVVAEAIVRDAPNAPVYRDHLEDLAVMAVTVADVSGVLIHPIPRTWEGIGGMSCGPWALPCFVTRAHPQLAYQADFWLRLLREGIAVCPRRPIVPDPERCVAASDVADERVDRARALLRLALP